MLIKLEISLLVELIQYIKKLEISLLVELVHCIVHLILITSNTTTTSHYTDHSTNQFGLNILRMSII